MNDFGLKIKGAEQLVAKLQRLEKKAARAAVRKAVRAGTKIILQRVRANTPVDEGLLRKAQDAKVIVKSNRSLGIVGANMQRLEAQSAASDGKRPSNIDHLVEYGHTAPDGTFVPPSGAMRRAADEALPIAEAEVARRLKAEIEAEATR